MGEDLEAEVLPRSLADGREELVEDVVARARVGGRNGAVDVAVGVAVLDPAHQVAVEDEDRVPAVEDRPVEAGHFDRIDPDGVAVEVEVLGVVARAQDVGRALAQGQRVVAVHVEGSGR